MKPIDKVNSSIFPIDSYTVEQNDLLIDLTSKKRKKSKNGSREEDKADSVFAPVKIDFSGAEDLCLPKNLTQFDKAVYNACGTLYYNGKDVVSHYQIYQQMGYTGKPNSKQLESITDSLKKMLATIFTFDNADECKLYKYPHFVYTGSLLPIQILEVYEKGASPLIKVRFTAKPPLFRFAIERKQYTTIPMEVMQVPIRRTEFNLTIRDYILDRIARMKSGGEKKIRYETMFDKLKNTCNITDRHNKNRCKRVMKEFLTHCKHVGYIRNFKEDLSGITISL